MIEDLIQCTFYTIQLFEFTIFSSVFNRTTIFIADAVAYYGDEDVAALAFLQTWTLLFFHNDEIIDFLCEIMSAYLVITFTLERWTVVSCNSK